MQNVRVFEKGAKNLAKCNALGLKRRGAAQMRAEFGVMPLKFSFDGAILVR